MSGTDNKIAKVSKELIKLQDKYGISCLKEAIKLMAYDVNSGKSEVQE